jgi:methionyl aminopeptidase
MTITYKDAEGVQGMRLAGRLASEVLDFLSAHVLPGVTTNALDSPMTTSPKCKAVFPRR